MADVTPVHWTPCRPARIMQHGVRVDGFYVIQRLAEIHRQELERLGVRERLVATIRREQGITLRSRLGELLVWAGCRLLAAEARRRPAALPSRADGR
jgi:hypothetical protein